MHEQIFLRSELIVMYLMDVRSGRWWQIGQNLIKDLFILSMMLFSAQKFTYHKTNLIFSRTHSPQYHSFSFLVRFSFLLHLLHTTHKFQSYIFDNPSADLFNIQLVFIHALKVVLHYTRFARPCGSSKSLRNLKIPPFMMDL